MNDLIDFEDGADALDAIGGALRDLQEDELDPYDVVAAVSTVRAAAHALIWDMIEERRGRVRTARARLARCEAALDAAFDALDAIEGMLYSARD